MRALSDRRFRAATAMVMTVVGCLAGSPLILAQGNVRKWNTFSVDVTVRQHHVTADGKPVDWRPPVLNYRIQRTASSSGWRTVTTFLSGEPFTAKTLNGTVNLDAYSVARVEDDGDGTPLRIIGRNGRLMSPPPPSFTERGRALIAEKYPDLVNALPNDGPSQPKGGANDWIEAFMPTVNKVAERRAALASRHGSPVGRDQGLDRYVSYSGRSRVEVLAEPATGLVGGVNVSTDGVLTAVTTISYVRGPADAYIRRAIHSEQRGADGLRSIADVEFSNVTTEERRAR